MIWIQELNPIWKSPNPFSLCDLTQKTLGAKNSLRDDEEEKFGKERVKLGLCR